jgi:hypothetical protein
MNRFHSPLRRIVVLGALALVALAMAGCSKKVNTVDPGFTAPEGQRAENAHHLVQADIPNRLATYKSHAASHPDDPDTLVSVDPLWVYGPSVMKGTIIDGTAASRYQILRRESNGGYLPMFDFDLSPGQRFPQSGWKAFFWIDPSPSGYQPPTYLGRGIVDGSITRTSPLTNPGIISATEPLNIAIASDSLTTIEFSRVPGATGYVLQVYTIRNGYPESEFINGAPSAYATEDHRDFLVEWIPATDGTPNFEKANVLTWFGLASSVTYLIRMSACDENGQLIGFSYGSTDSWSGPEDGYYQTFLTGFYPEVCAAFWENGKTLPRLSLLATPPMTRGRPAFDRLRTAPAGERLRRPAPPASRLTLR